MALPNIHINMPSNKDIFGFISGAVGTQSPLNGTWPVVNTGVNSIMFSIAPGTLPTAVNTTHIGATTVARSFNYATSLNSNSHITATNYYGTTLQSGTIVANTTANPSAC